MTSSNYAASQSQLTGMSAVTIKGLWANKSRFSLSAIAVIISVAFLTGMLILTSAIGGTAAEDIGAANTGLDVVVLGEELGLGDGPPGAETVIRGEIPVSVIDSLQGADGITAVAGIRTGSAQLVADDGSVFVTGADRAVGETWVEAESIATFVLVEGQQPTNDGIVIDRFTAGETGLAIGDDVRVVTDTGTVSMNINGIATFGDADLSPEASTVLFAESSTLLGTEGYERVAIDTELDAATIANLLAADGSGLVEVIDGAVYVDDLQSVANTEATFRSTFLLAFAIIALVAGTTIIYNTFVIAIAQRSRELALLRAIGASRSQVLKAVMIEAVVIGLVASAIGAVLGIATSFGLLALFEAIGFTITTNALVVPTSSIVIGMGVGIGVTLVSAFMPARKAAATPPIAALRDAAAEPAGLSRVRNLVGGLLMAGGLVAGTVGAISTDWMIATGGVLAAFVGLIVGGPMLSGWFARSASASLEKVNGTVGRLAGTNAARNPRRSASTALSLTLGVALIAFFTVVVASMSGTTAADTEAALRADQVVSSQFNMGGPDDQTLLPGSIADSIPLADGVEAVVPIASAQVVVDGTGTFAAGIASSTLPEVYDLGVTSGSLEDVSGTSIAVHVDAAELLSIGDEVSVGFPQAGEQVLTVAALFENDLPGMAPARYLLDEATFADVAPDAGDVLVLVVTDGSEQAASLIAASAEGALVQSAGDYVDSLGSAIDAFRNFVYALLAVAVIIAIVGIANTTVMAIGERTREIGMLRAVGMTAKQVRQMVRNEAILLSAQGSLLGLALGVGGCYAVFSAIDGGLALSLPVTSLAIVGVGAAASGVLAAAWPAWRAARMAPLEAMVA